MEETIYKLIRDPKGKFWFVGKDENDIWFWDQQNTNGLNGDYKTFRLGPDTLDIVDVRGPWCSNAKALFEETGEKVPLSTNEKKERQS